MENLNERERELVAIGAALGSNCVPCIEAHVPRAREAGLREPEIREAIQVADEVRKAPAARVLEVALGLAGSAPKNASEPAAAKTARGCCSMG